MGEGWVEEDEVGRGKRVPMGAGVLVYWHQTTTQTHPGARAGFQKKEELPKIFMCNSTA